MKDLAGELYFNLLDIKPGDHGEDTISLHVDNNDAWMCAQIANLKNFDNGCDMPEILVDNATTSCGNPGEGQGELQNYLKLTLWKDNGADEKACNNILDAGEEIFVNNQPISSTLWPLADATTGKGPFLGDKTYCVGVAWNVPISAGNIIQTDSVTADMRFVAVQSRNMDTFKCSELFTEVCDGIDNNYDGKIDEGNPGGGVACATGLQGICSAGTTQCNGGALNCVQTLQPATEICDGLDNDCDGSIDEGCPIVYLPFEENTGTTTADLSGHHNNGVITNATWTAGKVGYALSFDGSGDYVKLDKNGDLNFGNLTQFSIEFWVNRAEQTWDTVFSQLTSVKASRGPYDYLNQMVGFWHGSDEFYWRLADAAGNQHFMRGVYIIPLNSWHHLICVYDGQYMKVYVNGALAKSENIGAVTLAQDNPKYGALIGGRYFQRGHETEPSFLSADFGGKIDEFKIYDRGLTGAEALAHYQTGL